MASPIEDMLFNALIDSHCRSVAGACWWWAEESKIAALAWDPTRWRDRIAFLIRDHAVLSYRIDLMLVQARPIPRVPFRLAIECDGHGFHDRTKQQAAYDRARDRELLIQGVATIRFTGSEIFHSPERCAGEALAVFDALRSRSAEPEPYCTSWGG